ncbi:hypothetical protein [Enterococcus avium]|uniref:hypothetical protein n=1 Tax=Enterococcus avium TaxID=33945 RepID=UPI001F5672B6|nr:hypothetical protein [Enterococcus avium]
MAEMVTMTTEELSQRIAEEVKKQLAERNKPKMNYGYKFNKEVSEWLERQHGKGQSVSKYKTAIYEAVKACLEIDRISKLTEENYHLAVNVFDQQKIFFRRRVFAKEAALNENDAD